MSIDHAEPCPGDWVLTWGTSVDGHWNIQIECNGGNSGDCGWTLPLDFDSSDCITGEDLREYEDAHLRYRGRQQ